jgi:CRISPR-associated exonuclease Cas4
VVSGLEVQYYFICKRKLWLYVKDLGIENDNERVAEGKLLHERSYKNVDQKELLIDGQFKIDAIDGEYIREVKISSKMTEADRWQLLFYLYELKKRGLHLKGLISYTKEKRTEEVILTTQDEERLQEIIEDIECIQELPTPPSVINVPYCRKCAYYDFCYSDEQEEI